MPAVMGMTGKLGDILLSMGWISREDLRKAGISENRLPGERLGATLRRLNLVPDECIQQALAIQYGLPYLPLTWRLVDRQIEEVLPKAFLQKHRVVPMFRIEDELTIALDDPTNLLLVDEITRITGCNVLLVVASRRAIDLLLDDLLEDNLGSFEIDDFVESVDAGEVQIIEEKVDDLLDLEEVAGMSPVVRLVNYILFRSIKERASDIHLEPDERMFRIRCRIDGELTEMMTPPHRMHPAIVSRVKVMADLDISERRRPQDGRFRVMLDRHPVDVRVSTLPTVHGEKIVLRILDRSSMRIDLRNLGIGQQRLQALTELAHRPDGLVLVTGPTGSGKTTTLYALLEEINTPTKNLCTVENPVEYNLRGVNQVPANEKGGLRFADALRSLLRQDPDVLMIGEIRDKDTANIAVQASLTGHLVLATLHTNDAVSAVTRLLNMEIEPYLIGAALRGVLSQRLVRRLCATCRKPIDPAAPVLRHFGELPEGRYHTHGGCEACGGTGFVGRTGLYELLVLTDELCDAISGAPSLADLRRLATEQGLMSLRNDGVHKAAEGITSLDEVLRVAW
ncbi:MAG: ATPase, T2SS/T4P/T4SS family [Planctomycetota bacterium]